MESSASNLPDVPLLTVAVAAAAMMLVGWLWYSPFLFGKAWVRHSGIRPGDIRPKDAQRGHVFAVIVAFVGAYLLGMLSAHATNLPTLLLSIVFVWLFIALDQFNSLVWRRDPFSLFLLQAFRSLATLTVGALVFYFWR